MQLKFSLLLRTVQWDFRDIWIWLKSILQDHYWNNIPIDKSEVITFSLLAFSASSCFFANSAIQSVSAKINTLSKKTHWRNLNTANTHHKTYRHIIFFCLNTYTCNVNDSPSFDPFLTDPLSSALQTAHTKPECLVQWQSHRKLLPSKYVTGYCEYFLNPILNAKLTHFIIPWNNRSLDTCTNDLVQYKGIQLGSFVKKTC